MFGSPTAHTTELADSRPQAFQHITERPDTHQQGGITQGVHERAPEACVGGKVWLSVNPRGLSASTAAPLSTYTVLLHRSAPRAGMCSTSTGRLVRCARCACLARLPAAALPVKIMSFGTQSRLRHTMKAQPQKTRPYLRGAKQVAPAGDVCAPGGRAQAPGAAPFKCLCATARSHLAPGLFVDAQEASLPPSRTTHLCPLTLMDTTCFRRKSKMVPGLQRGATSPALAASTCSGRSQPRSCRRRPGGQAGLLARSAARAAHAAAKLAVPTCSGWTRRPFPDLRSEDDFEPPAYHPLVCQVWRAPDLLSQGRPPATTPPGQRQLAPPAQTGRCRCCPSSPPRLQLQGAPSSRGGKWHAATHMRARPVALLPECVQPPKLRLGRGGLLAPGFLPGLRAAMHSANASLSWQALTAVGVVPSPIVFSSTSSRIFSGSSTARCGWSCGWGRGGAGRVDGLVGGWVG